MKSNNIGAILDASVDSRHSERGKPTAVAHFAVELNTRQQKLLELLPNDGDMIKIKRSDVSMKDLATLTAHTQVEFALLTLKGKRIVKRGNAVSVFFSDEDIALFKREGWKLSGHTHISAEPIALIPSDGDFYMLELLGQKQSVIYNPLGLYRKYFIG